MDTLRQLSKTAKQSDSDASRNTLVCGTSGTGISTYLSHLIKQDIAKGKKIILIDPWGDLISLTKNTSNENARVVNLDQESARGLCNIFVAKSPKDYDAVARKVIELFVQIYDPNHSGVVGPRFEFTARNIILTLLYAGIPSFENMYRAMIDPTFTQQLLPHVPEGPVRQYWSQQMSQTSDFHKSEILDYVVSKFGIFMQEGPIKNIFESGDNVQDLISLMNTTQMLLIDTSSVRKNEAVKTVVYSALGSKLLELTEVNNDSTAIYIDEVNAFSASEQLLQAFEEGRRAKIEFTVASRNLESIPARLRSQILRFGTIVAYRQAVKDGQLLAENFLESTVTPQSLATQKKFMFSLRYVDGDKIKVSSDNTIDASL